nr:hypothetical protein CFP56_78156 [Quercus suber]
MFIYGATFSAENWQHNTVYLTYDSTDEGPGAGRGWLRYFLMPKEERSARARREFVLAERSLWCAVGPCPSVCLPTTCHVSYGRIVSPSQPPSASRPPSPETRPN